MEKDKKQGVVYILITNKIDFKLKVMKGDGEGKYILINEKSTNGHSILNIYASISRPYMIVKESILHLKSHVDQHTLIVVGDFDVTLSPWTVHSNKK